MKTAKRRRAGRSTDTVSALERGIAVLQCFTAGDPLSHGEIARQTGIPKPTVTRLVATLVALGYLRQARDSEKYVLGPGVLSLSRAFLAEVDIRARARPYMAKLAEQFGASVFLAVPDRLEMVIVETCRPRSTVLLSRIEVGSRIEMISSAMGRAYLHSLEQDERDGLLVRLRAENGAGWKTALAAAERAWRDTGGQGYCLSIGEWHPDISSAATVVRTPAGDRVGLNCGGPAFQFSEDRLRRQVAPQLLATARAIADDIGGAGPLPTPDLRLVAAGR